MKFGLLNIRPGHHPVPAGVDDGFELSPIPLAQRRSDEEYLYHLLNSGTNDYMDADLYGKAISEQHDKFSTIRRDTNINDFQ